MPLSKIIFLISFFKTIFRPLFFLIIFLIFLYPFEIKSQGDGLSINYSYIFFPAIILILKENLKAPSKNIIIIILFYYFIFLFATITHSEIFNNLDRRIFSFIIFISVFFFTIVKIDNDMIKAFKIANVIFAICHIFVILNIYFKADLIEVGSLKELIGSQRYGYIYILAFWILIFYQPSLNFLNIVRLACIALIITGLLLTFSRSSIVALLGSLIIYLFSKFFYKKNVHFYGYTKIITNYSILFLFLFIFLKIFFSEIINFYYTRLILLLDIELLFSHFRNPETSEGYRILMFKKILESTLLHPFVGSGFLGIWNILENFSGSAHSQYADVLYRTGLFGFFIYIVILYSLYKYLSSRHSDFFFGFIGILIYGFFNETFKLSQGSFILTFLIGMMFNDKFYVKFLNMKVKYYKKKPKLQK